MKEDRLIVIIGTIAIIIILILVAISVIANAQSLQEFTKEEQNIIKSYLSKTKLSFSESKVEYDEKSVNKNYFGIDNPKIATVPVKIDGTTYVMISTRKRIGLSELKELPKEISEVD